MAGISLDMRLVETEPQDFLFIRDQQETMTNAELREYIDKQRNRGSGNLSIFEVEYYKRYASPLAAFILSSIGMSLSRESTSEMAPIVLSACVPTMVICARGEEA